MQHLEKRALLVQGLEKRANILRAGLGLASKGAGAVGRFLRSFGRRAAPKKRLSIPPNPSKFGTPDYVRPRIVGPHNKIKIEKGRVLREGLEKNWRSKQLRQGMREIAPNAPPSISHPKAPPRRGSFEATLKDPKFQGETRAGPFSNITYDRGTVGRSPAPQPDWRKEQARDWANKEFPKAPFTQPRRY